MEQTPIKMLEVLFKRMETHPEEFGDSGRWMRILHHYADCLTEAESKEIKERLLNTRRARLDMNLMKELAGESAPQTDSYFHPYNSKADTLTYTTQGRFAFPSEKELEAMKEELSEVKESRVNKSHYTLAQIQHALQKAKV